MRRAAIEAWAAAQGCTNLYLPVEAANVGAIALYESFGFGVAGRYHLRVKP
jgi:ribosomal protein S18 acetylase RimI-like enzyme